MSSENLESKRWLIAGAAIIMQLCLGTVYAWSVFKIPLMKAHPGLSSTAIDSHFSLVYCPSRRFFHVFRRSDFVWLMR